MNSSTFNNVYLKFREELPYQSPAPSAKFCKPTTIDPDTLTRLVLDPSAMVKPTVADECGLTQVELYTREYIHEIHKKESPN